MNSFLIFFTRENLFFLYKSFLPVQISSFYQNPSYLYEFLLLMKIFSTRENLFFWWKSFLSVRVSSFFILRLSHVRMSSFLWDHLFASFLRGLWQLATKVGSTLRSRFSAEVHFNGIFTASHWFHLEESASYGIWTFFHKQVSMSRAPCCICSATGSFSLKL